MRKVEVPPTFSVADIALVQRPDLGPPGPGQVLVRMRAASLNYRDLLVATGHGRWKPPAGRVIGSDGAGEIVAKASDVTRFNVGDRRNGGLGGPAADGVLAEWLLLDAEALVLAPPQLSDLDAATLPTAALTAWHAITRANALRPGATILVEGTGGVSLFALQIGVAVGARVIATSSSDQKLARMIDHGAVAGVNYVETPQWSEDVLAATGGEGVDLAIDTGGASSLNESIKSTAMGGVVAIVGLLGGLQATIDLAEVFQRNMRLEGIETGSRDMLEDMVKWFAEHKISPAVDRVFTFEESGKALAYLKESKHVGKVCIKFETP